MPIRVAGRPSERHGPHGVVNPESETEGLLVGHLPVSNGAAVAPGRSVTRLSRSKLTAVTRAGELAGLLRSVRASDVSRCGGRPAYGPCGEDLTIRRDRAKHVTSVPRLAAIEIAFRHLIPAVEPARPAFP